MKTATKCPSCNAVADTPFTTCPACGLIVEKFYQKQAERVELDRKKAIEAEQKRLDDEKKAADLAQKQAKAEELKNRKKPCRFCKMEIPFEAKICPHCRKDVQIGSTKVLIVCVVATLVAITLIMSGNNPAPAKPAPTTPAQTQQVAANGSEEKAVELVKRCPVVINDSQTTIINYFSVLMTTLKSGGTFVEFEGWEAVAAGGSEYDVYVHYKCNGKRIEAHWQTDLNNKAVRAKNQEAFILNGKRDVVFAN